MENFGTTVSVDGLLMGAFKCDNCERLSVAWHTYSSDSRMFTAEEMFEHMIEYAEWIPKVGVGKQFDDVPEHIAAAASESYSCFSIHAYRAAVLLARSVVEATAKEKGVTQGNLKSKIDGLHGLHLIRPSIQDAAHEIRFLGNDMAHGDFVAPVEVEEAAETLVLMGELLQEVFQSPARIERMKQARLAKAAAKNKEAP
ncbi:DUF4145 domain-containing protein [Amycolatopsis sp. CA-230715]|uniref:DUF4145 domain-containing protein n=1 Tax=Amycolatopsis sp. CA-230715 TaxID=2745196 RepID=UPI001C00966A|nr:DUF4145 domain-containing protein [Amycolatopsis sp. CA-230715]QWF80132.1 hypothetical protein HUW46_03550 [Amycolatopsis sp. CA-230715]